MTITAEKIIIEAIKSLDEEPKMLHGIYPNMENETYHAIKSHLSRTALMDFNTSPFTYWAKHINPERPKKDATAQMELGSAFHTLMLEPHLFDSLFAIEPKKVLLKNVGRELYDAYKKECEAISESKKIVLTYETWETLNKMISKVQSNEQAMELIRDARIEHSLFWQDDHSGLYLKARPDIWHDNMIVDLKTTNNASPRAFQYEMVDYGYHIQFAMIRDGIEKILGHRINHFINIVIETKYPHNMAIYIMDEFAVDEGQVKYKNILLDMKNSFAENNFKDYGIQTIGLPRWAS